MIMGSLHSNGDPNYVTVFLRLIPATACVPWRAGTQTGQNNNNLMKTAWPSLLASAVLSSNGSLNSLTYFLGYTIAVKVPTPSSGSEIVSWQNTEDTGQPV